MFVSYCGSYTRRVAVVKARFEPPGTRVSNTDVIRHRNFRSSNSMNEINRQISDRGGSNRAKVGRLVSATTLSRLSSGATKLQWNAAIPVHPDRK